MSLTEGTSGWNFEGILFFDHKSNAGKRTETILYVCEIFKSIVLVSVEEKRVQISVGKKQEKETKKKE